MHTNYLKSLMVAIALEARYMIDCNRAKEMGLNPYSRSTFLLGFTDNLKLAMSEYL